MAWSVQAQVGPEHAAGRHGHVGAEDARSQRPETEPGHVAARRDDRGRAAITTRLELGQSGRRGIGAFFTPTGFGTPLGAGKETRVIDGKGYLLEYPIHGDVAVVAAHQADALGNLVYRKTARNFGPIMAAAAQTTVVQVDQIVPAGALDPEHVITPCLYVDRVVRIERNPAISGASP
jgi:acyl CoA:acetate/3-ketoacid CoA transferase alpha subunit